jgi:hypothetical protein
VGGNSRWAGERRAFPVASPPLRQSSPVSTLSFQIFEPAELIHDPC